MMSKESSSSLGIKNLEAISLGGFFCFEEDELVTARLVFIATFSSSSSRCCLRVTSAFSKSASGKRVIVRSTSYKVPVEAEKLSKLCKTLRSSTVSCSQAKRAATRSCIDCTSCPLFCRHPPSGLSPIPHHCASCPSCSSLYSPSTCRNVFILSVHTFSGRFVWSYLHFRLIRFEEADDLSRQLAGG